MQVSGMIKRTNGSQGSGQAGPAEQWVRRLVDRVDARDTSGWLEYLSDNARFCFGNAPPVLGRRAIGEAISAFFFALSALEHEIIEIWMPPGAVIFRGKASYTRADGSTLTIPFANFLKLDDHGLIREYLIYADTSSL